MYFYLWIHNLFKDTKEIPGNCGILWHKVVTFCFFITYRCSKTTLLWHHFAWSWILVVKEVNTIATRGQPVPPQKEVLRKVKGHQPSDEEWTLILIKLYLRNYSRPIFSSGWCFSHHCDTVSPRHFLAPALQTFLSFYSKNCLFRTIDDSPKGHE